MKTINVCKNERGFVLLVVYGLITLIAIFSTAIFVRSYVFAQANERNINKITAFNMAESGVDWAITQLAGDPTYTGTPSYVSMDSNSAQGGFTVTVTNVANNPLIRMIQATGFSPDNDSTSRAYQTSTITAYCEFQTSQLFEYGIFAENGITLTGSGQNASVDSYNSNNGAYGGANVGNGGNVAVNNSAAGSITLSGNTLINGDAVIGPGGDVATGIEIGPNAAITGTTSVAAEPVEYPLLDTTLPSSGDLTISTGTQTLSTGIYHYSSLSVSGQGVLTSSGPVIIYVDGAVTLSGQAVSSTNDIPENMLIIVKETGSVSVSGQGTVHAGIYAPKSTVTNNGNGGIFGAIVAKNYVQTGNGSLHFDESLLDLDGNPVMTDPSVITWQEQNTLTWGT